MARRVETDRLRELVRLHRMGTSARQVARLLRIGPNTARRYRRVFASAGLLDGQPDVAQLPSLDGLRAAVTAGLPLPAPRPPKPSSLGAWRTKLAALFAKGLGPRATFDRLREESRGSATPFRASYSAVKRACRQLRREQGGPDDVVVPVESGAGEVAQVDFGYVGKLYDPTTGVLRRAWVWVMVCGFSRVMVVRLVFDQRVETWLDLHRQAFQELGGSVTTLVPDNCRRAVLRAAFGIDGPTELERSYRELARHYGCVIDPTPPGSPRMKGKAEAAVRYLKHGPLKRRDGEPMDQVQAALARWNEDVASVRVHGTTGLRPRDVFDRVERAALRPLPREPYEPVVWKKAKVHPDCHVAFRERLYSVPWTLVGSHVWLRATARTVEAHHQDRPVAVHPRHGPHRSTVEQHLPPDRRDLRHRGRAFWEERAARVGPETSALVREVFDLDDVLSHLRRVQAIVKYLEQHPKERAEATSLHVRRAGDLSYHAVKRVLTRALDVASRPAAP